MRAALIGPSLRGRERDREREGERGRERDRENGPTGVFADWQSLAESGKSLFFTVTLYSKLVHFKGEDSLILHQLILHETRVFSATSL